MDPLKKWSPLHWDDDDEYKQSKKERCRKVDVNENRLLLRGANKLFRMNAEGQWWPRLTSAKEKKEEKEKEEKRKKARAKK